MTYDYDDDNDDRIKCQECNQWFQPDGDIQRCPECEEYICYECRDEHRRYWRIEMNLAPKINNAGKEAITNDINNLAGFVHFLNEKWWQNPETKERIDRNVGEMLMLVVSELAEAMEGHRKNLNDDHIPHRKMFEVELADAMIRIMDIAVGTGCDLGAAVADKLAYNEFRKDHSFEARLEPNGKKY